MFCPDCGAESTERRNYCKQCGGALAGSANTGIALPAKSNALAWSIALFTVLLGLGGLVTVFTTAYDLAQREGMDAGIPIVLMVFGSTSVVAVVALMVNMTLRLAGTSIGQAARPKAIPRRDTNPVQLPAPSPAIDSVTEHTTRTFEPVERAHSARE